MTATYRLQLHAGFTFADAERRSRPTSRTSVSPTSTSRRCWRPCLARCTATTSSTTPGSARSSAARTDWSGSPTPPASTGSGSWSTWCPTTWRSSPRCTPTRRSGGCSPRVGRPTTAHWFDVDWDALDGRIGLPVLGDTLDATVAAGELVLDEHDGRPVVRLPRPRLPRGRGDRGPRRRGRRGRSSTGSTTCSASWREKDELLNYRRFFDIDGLIAVRVEDPDVFEATHRVLLDLNHRGVVEGFRIDHPDGLADPEGYLRDAAPGHPGRHRDLGREDPRGRRAAAHRVDVRRHDRLRRHPRDHRRARRPDDRTAAGGDLETRPAAATTTPRRSRRPSARSSASCWRPSGDGWSAGRPSSCPTPTPPGWTRRSPSCWSPVTSTAPTPAPAGRRRARPWNGSRTPATAPSRPDPTWRT